jgi:hypothetical protein
MFIGPMDDDELDAIVGIALVNDGNGSVAESEDSVLKVSNSSQVNSRN